MLNFFLFAFSIFFSLFNSKQNTKGLDCPAGSYQPANGSATCLPCIPGKYTTNAGKTECIDCDVNTFATSLGSSFCAPCPTQRTTKNKGSVQCQVCGKGKKKVSNNTHPEMYTCVACGPGYWSDSDSLECTACPKGFHTAATNSKSCKVCEAGRYNDIQANSKEAETACTKCIAGRYSSAKGVTDGNDCNKCAAGKKNPTPGSNSSSACTDCDAMQKSEAGNSSCEICSVGKISETGSAKW